MADSQAIPGADLRFTYSSTYRVTICNNEVQWNGVVLHYKLMNCVY